MANPLIRKLENFALLSPSDRAALEDMARDRTRFAAREDLVRQGDPTEGVYLILDGWACRYNTLPDGRRQITAYLVPGDMCDQRIFLLRTMDHSIATLTPALVAVIPAESILAVTDNHARIMHALWWNTMVDAAITREWVMNVGQRTALERLAHLICELFFRLRAVGLAQDTTFALPLTQTELADTLGLTNVHVNRTLRRLREDGLISVHRDRFTVCDLDALLRVAVFNASYLHLEHEGMEFDAEDHEPV